MNSLGDGGCFPWRPNISTKSGRWSFHILDISRRMAEPTPLMVVP